MKVEYFLYLPGGELTDLSVKAHETRHIGAHVGELAVKAACKPFGHGGLHRILIQRLDGKEEALGAVKDLRGSGLSRNGMAPGDLAEAAAGAEHHGTARRIDLEAEFFAEVVDAPQLTETRVAAAAAIYRTAAVQIVHKALEVVGIKLAPALIKEPV